MIKRIFDHVENYVHNSVSNASGKLEKSTGLGRTCNRMGYRFVQCVGR